MSRLPLIQPQQAHGEARQLLDAVQSRLGVVPNFIKVLASSPSALGAFVGMHGALEHASIDVATRERIALAVAESNACRYCVSAHSAIGRKAGLDAAEILRNRQGSSSDAKAAAAVAFARALNEGRGDVRPEDLSAVRAAGHGDAEIVEILALVAMNFFTNVLGKAMEVDIDFPRVELLEPAGHACPAC